MTCAFQNVLQSLNIKALAHRQSALMAKEMTEAGGQENMVIECHLAMLKLSDGKVGATDSDGKPLVNA